MTPAMARGDPERFARRLAALKKEGSLLLVQSENAGAREAVSTQLLGDPELGRTPVFALFGHDRSVVQSRFDGPADRPQIIEHEFFRSAAQADRGPGAASAGRLESLEQLTRELHAAVGDIVQRREDGLGPGELRICLDSLTPVIDGFDHETVEGFLEDLRSLMTEHGGMAHAVLPRRPLPEDYGWLERSFDAMVDARARSGVAEERWRLTTDDLTTEWFAVEDVDPR